MSAPRDNRPLDRLLLAAYRDQQGRLSEPGHRWPYEIAEAAGYPWKVAYRRMERLVELGFVDYGVSLRTGWLTEKGRARLAELETIEDASAPSGRRRG